MRILQLLLILTTIKLTLASVLDPGGNGFFALVLVIACLPQAKAVSWALNDGASVLINSLQSHMTLNSQILIEQAFKSVYSLNHAVNPFH